MLRPNTKTVERLDRIKLVLMDVDGTLVTSDQLTFSRVLRQLRGLKSLGVRSSIATGRTLHGVSPILQQMSEVGEESCRP
jgi:hydroxymethylpyrimidine pyrophosphatase-like HAD family hydrolase